MKKNSLFKSMLLLCVLMVGVGNVWADDNVKWVKTDPADLVAGDVVAIVDTTTCSAIANDPKEGKAPSGKAVTLTTNKDQIDTSSGDLAANLQWTVAIPEEGKFQFKKDDTNFLFTKPNNADTDSLLVGAADGDGEVKDFQLVKDGANNQADFLFAKMSEDKGYYVGTIDYRFMKMWGVRPSINEDISSTVITFFKKVESNKKDLKILFEKDNYEFDLDGGSTFTSPIATTDPEGKTLTYSSSNDYVAQVTETGEVTVRHRGIATITASFAGDEEYDATSAAYTLRVDKSNEEGGMNNPLTASDAYLAISNGDLATGCVYFVKGIVSNITGNNEDILGAISSFIDIPGVNSDGGVTYYISDNGSSAEDVLQLEVTAGRGLENGDLKAQRNLCIGDEVIVVGQLSYASSTPGMSIGGSGGGSGGDSNKESEKTPKIDKGNYMYQYTPRIVAPDVEVSVGTSQKVKDYCVVNDECETAMQPGEPEVKTSNDNVSITSGKMNANEVGVDTLTVSCPFKVNESDAEPVFTTAKQFYVTVTPRDVEPVGKLPGYLELVTDASTLQENDSILIVATKGDKSYALSSTGAIMGGMSGKEVTIEEDSITIKSVPDGATPVKLKAVGDKWALNTTDKNYFYTSLNNSGGGFDLSSLISDPTNKLRHGEITGEEIGDSAQVTIAIDAKGIATITMRGDSIMRYAETALGTGGSTGSTGSTGSGGSTGSSSSYDMSAFNCYAQDATDGVLVKIFRFRAGPNFDITVGNNGWRELVSAKDVALPEGLTAYIIKEVADGKATVEPVTTVKAGEPYILKGSKDATYTLTLIDEAKAPEGNLLKVSTAETEDGVYVLDTGGTESIFYKWDDALVGTGHPYLPEELGGDATSLTIRGFKGDANGDGKVNIADITLIVNHIMGETSEDFILIAADVDMDGDVDSTDIAKIVNIMLGK